MKPMAWPSALLTPFSHDYRLLASWKWPLRTVISNHANQSCKRIYICFFYFFLAFMFVLSLVFGVCRPRLFRICCFPRLLAAVAVAASGMLLSQLLLGMKLAASTHLGWRTVCVFSRNCSQNPLTCMPSGSGNMLNRTPNYVAATNGILWEGFAGVRQEACQSIFILYIVCSYIYVYAYTLYKYRCINICWRKSPIIGMICITIHFHWIPKNTFKSEWKAIWNGEGAGKWLKEQHCEKEHTDRTKKHKREIASNRNENKMAWH